MVQLKHLRHGLMKMDLMVSAILLSVVFGSLGTIFTRFERLWQTTRHFQLANQELMNQMDALSQLSADECQRAIEQIKISEAVLKAMPNAKIDGEFQEGIDCHRLTLRFYLPEQIRHEPIVLINWCPKHSESSMGEPL